MLIITADDYGKNRLATDNILKCFADKRITSASAMVFMEDSERAAPLALKTGLEVGLHLNFTESFNANNIPLILRKHQDRVIAFLAGNKYAEIIFNPFLSDSFKYLFQVQQKEFLRLYGKPPDFINGHHHMHLCMNVLAGSLLSESTRIRGTFTFGAGEKNRFNLLYRKILDKWITKRFISPDSFYSIAAVQNQQNLENIVDRALNETIEIEVHPENLEEINFLLSDRYRYLIDSVQMSGFRHLPDK